MLAQQNKTSLPTGVLSAIDQARPCQGAWRSLSLLSFTLFSFALLSFALLLNGCGALTGGRTQPAPTTPSIPGGRSESAPPAPPTRVPSRPQAPTANQPQSTLPSPSKPVEPSATRPDTTARPGARSRIPDKAIELAGNCNQTEEDGYKEQATLSVTNNQVKAMSWQLWVGKKGSCKFDFADFVQTKTQPSIELSAKDGSACKLVIYQDPRRVTLGFADCQRRCTGNIYDSAYPVMFDPKTGACANLSH